MKNFTFKKHPRETGLASVASQSQIVDIKHNKLRVGAIYPPDMFTDSTNWYIQLAVKTEENTFGWKYIYFYSEEFKEEKDARDWLKEQKDFLFYKHVLHYFED